MLEAKAWLSADDERHRGRHETLHGKVAALFELLDADVFEVAAANLVARAVAASELAHVANRRG